MVKSSKKLKVALQSQQTRLKAKQKISQAAQAAEQKGKARVQGGPSRKLTASVTKGRGKKQPVQRRPTIPYSATDKVLLIGEGNFSFARALLVEPPAELQFFPPNNLTATAYDSEEECYAKYKDAQEIVATLREKGAEVLFGVDATRLEHNPSLKGRKWDRLVWNFPHAGKGITDQDRNILTNQLLILGFLRSALKFLKLGAVPTYNVSTKKKKSEDSDEDEEDAQSNEDASPQQTKVTRGTILITLRNVTPYNLWDVPRLAKNPAALASSSAQATPRYTLLRSFVFHREMWKGYEHRMTKGERANGTGTTGEGGEDRTWEFCVRDEEAA